MSIDELCALPVETLAEKDCLLFLWATFPQLPEALRLIKAWGFTFKTVAFVWLKLNRKSPTWFYGLGYWTRGNAEICLLAKRGHPKRYSKSVHQFIISPVAEHSKKPDITREKIIALAGDLPRAELFARQKTPGWDVWGNELGQRFFPVRTRNEVTFYGLCNCTQGFNQGQIKVVFGLTKRQLICFGGALLVGVPLFFLIRGRVPTSAAALIMVFAMLPGFLLALYEKHGQPLEVVVRQIVECCFIQPKERPYQTNNAYTALMRQSQMEKEVNAIVQKAKERNERKSAGQAHPRRKERDSGRHPKV